MATRPATIVALLHGPDQPGLVARVSGWIFDRGGNIVHADQHRDQEEAVFFQRVEWSHEGADLRAEARAFGEFSRDLGMTASCALSTHRTRMALFVSGYDHCFDDLVLRWQSKELRADIACVVSNHRTAEAKAVAYGLPFFHTPVTAADKPRAEARQLEILREHGVELVVLARYMQVLTEPFLAALGRPVINIHHSFLPAFAGSRPYHQAYGRGVKLVGATAHYATPLLDDGPIIAQDVVQITHRDSVPDLIRKGRDLERLVLSRAVRWHLERRILVYGRKTVVFD